MRYRETLSGEEIETPLALRALPLPRDNWYSDVSPGHRHTEPRLLAFSGPLDLWGTAPASLFALYDDGAGFRWFPVEAIED